MMTLLLILVGFPAAMVLLVCWLWLFFWVLHRLGRAGEVLGALAIGSVTVYYGWLLLPWLWSQVIAPALAMIFFLALLLLWAWVVKERSEGQ